MPVRRRLIRESVRIVLQDSIESKPPSGSAPTVRAHRGPGHRTQRHRPRVLATKAGDVELRIPKLRKGSFFPSILEPRRRMDQGLYAVVMEAYVNGVSTRSVDDLVDSPGRRRGDHQVAGVPHLRGPRRDVAAFRTRPSITPSSPTSTWTPPTSTSATADTAQVVSMAAVVATGIAAEGPARSSGSTSATVRTRCSGVLPAALKARGWAGCGW